MGRRAVIPAIVHKTRHIVALLCLFQAGSALGATATELFADGNRLFRDDLYWAALLRYSQAEQAGMDAPLLHYNAGVAHYRAQQHGRARESLLRAAREPRLRAISHYNLGLNSYAAKDIDAALRWFRKARDQQSNKKISNLAQRAIARLQRETVQPMPTVMPADTERQPRRLFDFDLNARVSAGSDSNVYRSPSASYVDLADPNTPTVTPAAQSGIFLPYELRVKYSVNSLEYESFYAAYRINGRIYQDDTLGNADEYRHEVSFGSQYHRLDESRERRIFSAFAIAQHHETYYDPDDGTERVASGGQNISDRMSYLRYGPEVRLQQSFERFSFGGKLAGQLWNYEEVVAVPEYDHEYILLGLNAQYRFTKSSLLRFSVDGYTRRYGDRPSFELDGRQLPGNPTIEYAYLQYGVTARQRIGSALWFGFGYTRTRREDKYLGYNDYTRDTYNVDIRSRLGPKFEMRANAYYRVYDYENAFAFHSPAAGRKTLETINGSV
ncbi:MAG: hypothetical protein ACE5EU_07395, partial [Paracoccaceae bacterium]